MDKTGVEVRTTTTVWLQGLFPCSLCVEVSPEPVTRAMLLELEVLCWHSCAAQAS